MNCASCGKPLPPPPWFRRDECPSCGASLHSCVHCFFHSPSHHNECREPQAERVVEKDRANFCDYFKPGTVTGQAGGDPKKDALAALDSLFKK